MPLPHMVTRGDTNVFMFPRRNCIDQLTPLELVLYEAMRAIDAADGHPLMTDALNLVAQARNKVADYLEQ